MDAADEPEPEPLPVKVSVSDLKIQSMEELDMEDFTILTHEEKEEEKPVPCVYADRDKRKIGKPRCFIRNNLASGDGSN